MQTKIVVSGTLQNRIRMKTNRKRSTRRVFDLFILFYFIFYIASSYLSEDLSCVPLFLSEPLGSHPVLFSPLQCSFPLLRCHLQQNTTLFFFRYNN